MEIPETVAFTMQDLTARTDRGAPRGRYLGPCASAGRLPDQVRGHGLAFGWVILRRTLPEVTRSTSVSTSRFSYVGSSRARARRGKYHAPAMARRGPTRLALSRISPRRRNGSPDRDRRGDDQSPPGGGARPAATWRGKEAREVGGDE